MGDVDALLALAECASQRAWTRPTVDGKALTIEGLRHPLVDEAVSDYIPSDVKLGGDGAKNRCWLRPVRMRRGAHFLFALRVGRQSAVEPVRRRGLGLHAGAPTATPSLTAGGRRDHRCGD